MHHKIHPLLMLLILILGFQAVGGALGMMTSGNMEPWYNGLVKSPLTPPGYAFGIAWTILYAFLAFSIWLIWKQPTSQKRTNILMLFAAHMILNWAWTPVFFAAHEASVAFALLVVILLTAIFLCKMMWNQDRRAALLLLPYIVWLCFASHLNHYIWIHN